MNDLIKYSLKNLWKRKLRSFLTISSILIGISAIFALLSFGQGIQKYIDDFSKEMGVDKIMIFPKGGFYGLGATVKFNDEDVDFIKKIKGVRQVVGWCFDNGKIEYKKYKPAYGYVIGIPAEEKEYELFKEMFSGIDIIKGRELKKGDVLKAVLGYNYQADGKIFKKGASVGDKIKINGVEFEIIGFYEEIGNPSDDSQVYLSFEGYEKVYGKRGYEYIALSCESDQNPSEFAEIVKEKFRKYRNLEKGKEDFIVQTLDDMLATYTNVITIINSILVLIALVSVIVASVNIANTMYTTIIERTQEIGIMKAIGAKNNTILYIFVIESGILSSIGGIFGIFLGYIIAKIGEYIAVVNGLSMLKPYFPIWLIIGCLIFSFLIGVISGYFPARKAAKMNAADSLRYE